MSAKRSSKSTRGASVRPRDRSAPRPSASASKPDLPPGIDRPLFEAMSLRTPLRHGRDRLNDAEVERALISGEHARILEAYFGEAEYAQLRQLAARATRSSRLQGPRVFVLPGILGSMLAEQRGKNSDTIWVDLLDISFGRLSRLKLPEADRRIQAIDVHKPSYLKLKLQLQAEGFNADFHPFDWRRSIADLGRELAKRIADDPAEEIYLVAHSMGGLVSRAAIHHGAGDKIKRLIMLGTPNYGSFAPAMVFRGAYPFLNKIALIDLKHSPEELAGEIFNTHPGLTQMLPQRGKYDSIDLYDITQWPTSGARPLKPLLQAAPDVQQQLAVIPEKFVMIAGVDRETTVGLKLADNSSEFVFERSRAGDGTVPLDFAVLPNVLTYYHAEEHGSLPSNPTVQKAVVDLLRKGTTSLLADRWEQTRADVAVEVSESELRRRFAAQITRSAADFSASDLRNIIAEFAAPAKAGPAPTAAASTPLAPKAAELINWQSLVVGRRRQRRIDVHIARGSITQVRSRAYLLGLFQNVEPGGAALAIDNLMNGTLREFRQRRMFAAGAGEVLLLPAGRSELLAEHVVFVGLGHFDSFNLQVLETVAENVARTLARMDLEELTTVPIGANTGIDVESALSALLRGFFRGLDDADAQHNFRRITFCEVDETRFEQLKWTLYRLWSTPLCENVEVTLHEEKLPPAPAARRDSHVGIPPCIYLNVRAQEDRADPGSLVFESSLLTTGAKATVLSGALKVSRAALATQLEKIEGKGFTFAALPTFGRELASLVLHDAIIAGLEGTAGNHLVVVHDAEASRVPWETLYLGEAFPALTGGVSRRYLAANLSVSKWLEQRRHTEWLEILLVVNPTQDLEGAEQEGARIEKLFNAGGKVRLTIVRGKEATRARLKKEFASGKYDILHYAGHAEFDPIRPSRSGVLCSDGSLTGAELVELGNLPSLVFFNACESARVRSKVKKESKHVSHNLVERIERNTGLAEAFMRGGVANYLGTYWPVGDASAKTFAEIFYTSLLAGETIAQALGKSRAAVYEIGSEDWADYLLYGSLDFVVKSTR